MKKITLLLILLANVVLADLTRNNNIVTDDETSLQWQDNSEIGIIYKSWKEAITYCENLSLDGFNDWRLPTKNELLSLIDYTKFSPAIKSTIFQNTTSNGYWSSTPLDNYEYYYIDFRYGKVSLENPYYMHDIRCVRVGE